MNIKAEPVDTILEERSQSITPKRRREVFDGVEIPTARPVCRRVVLKLEVGKVSDEIKAQIEGLKNVCRYNLCPPKL